MKFMTTVPYDISQIGRNSLSMNNYLIFFVFIFVSAMIFFSCNAANLNKSQPGTHKTFASEPSVPTPENNDGQEKNQETFDNKHSGDRKQALEPGPDFSETPFPEQSLSEETELQAEKSKGDDSVITEFPSDDATAYYYYTKSAIHRQRREYGLAIEALLKAVKKDPNSFFLKKELILLYLNNEETNKALDVAKSMTEQYPRNTEGLMMLAKLKEQLNQKDDAREIYQKILQMEPDRENVYFVLGNIYMENENIDEAFIIFSKMAQHFPDSYVAHFFLGKIHAGQKNPDYAVKEFKKTLELKPDLVEPRLELIDIYKTLQSKTKSNSLDKKIIRLYQEILVIEKHNINAALELPVYYFNKGMVEKAEKMLAEFGRQNRNNQGIAMLAAKEFLGSDRFKDASIVFSGLAKGDPENSLYHYLAGVAFDSLKQADIAIYHFMKVKPESENYKKAILHISFLYSELDRTGQAIEFLQEKSSQMPNDIDIITYLASLYEDTEQLEPALEVLKRGLEIDPENTNLLFKSGIVLDKSGNKTDCIKIMKRVIMLDPENASALNYLGYTYADMGINLDEAETLVLKALDLKPDDGYITDSLGWVYYQKGNYDKAVEYLEKAVNLSDSDPVITEHLGDAYLKKGLLDKALEAYKNALAGTDGQENRFLLRKKIYRLKNNLNEQE